jgi:hypothetical protein
MDSKPTHPRDGCNNVRSAVNGASFVALSNGNIFSDYVSCKFDSATSCTDDDVDWSHFHSPLISFLLTCVRRIVACTTFPLVLSWGGENFRTNALRHIPSTSIPSLGVISRLRFLVVCHHLLFSPSIDAMTSLLLM